MKGSVLGFDPETNSGAISGHDGRRYDFVRLDWRGPTPPSRGAVVDFVAENGRAAQIYPLGLHGSPGEGETANAIYILYLISLAVGITGVVGLVMAYVNQAGSPEWIKAHLRFQIRTFWIGLLYIVTSLVTSIIVIGLFGWLFTMIWLIVRCAKGMQALARGAPPPNVATWLW